MRKKIVVMLAVAMIIVLVSVVACNTVKTVEVTLYVTEGGSPIKRIHTVGENDLPTYGNGTMKFGGWYYDKQFNQAFDPDSEEENQVLYAKWESVDLAEKITLTLDSNYGGAQKATEQVNKGSTYNLPSPNRGGYTFVGWFTSPTGGINWTDEMPFTVDITLYAHWTEIGQQVEQVTLTLNLNYTGAATPTTVTINKGATYSLTTPTRSGYTFDGWFTQAAGGTQYTSSTAINADTTLYAHWTEIQEQEKVTLTLNLNYTGAATPTTVTINKGATYSLTTPTRSGYTFDGWFTQAAGGTQYTNSTAINADTTLYAHWTENTVPPTDQVVLTIDPTTLTMNNESASTYYEKYNGTHTINGYSVTTSDVSVNAYVGSQVLQCKAKTGTITVSGAFSKLVIVYETSYEYASSLFLVSKDGADIRPATATSQEDTGRVSTGTDGNDYPIYAYTIEITLDSSKSSTYQIGCLSDQNGARYFASVVFYGNSSGTVTPTPTPETVTLTLNLNYTGSSSPTSVTINKGSTYNLTTPTRSGYTFDGWYTQATGGTKYTSSTAINADTTLYAHWTEISQGSTGSVKEQFLTSVVSQPQEGESYYIAMYYKLTDSVYYGVNSINGNKLFSTETKSEATVATIEKTSNGFHIKLGTQYLSLSSSSAVSLTSSASTVFYVGENNILIATYNDAEYTLGSYQSGTSTTLYTYFGVSKASFSTGTNASKVDVTQFPVRLVTLDGSSAPIYPMENQVYDADTFDNKNLQEKCEELEYFIGLPSTGTYNALVIPVQFAGDTITQTQLNNLNIAFNGTSDETGWESVKSFYDKSSYGNLKITFDITSVFQASNNASYYSSYNGTYNYSDGTTESKDGSALILEEALAWCISQKINLSQYDNNNDGCIDAVYLIYSASVDYSYDSFYWAYVTWYYGEDQFDGLDAYYYLFAGFDFMDEKVPGKDTQGYTTISGLKINAETYIHETGHLLGLDDYYDYDENSGSNQGLGGADMMDYNVGDHGVYSKIMLGWLTPEIVTSTKTVTIQSSQEGGYAILIPLNWNNSYFCEYLLIDLYTNTGLNAMSASQTNSILYDGASYGVRIYHVSSAVTNPYSDNYGSFTDNNNSLSSIPLIKLVEADGETSKSTEGSWASASDLWQTGDSLSTVFPNYARNDGKLLNFNITIDSVSAESATITITYNTTEAA